jgi:lambda family phage tail tape measure protein
LEESLNPNLGEFQKTLVLASYNLASMPGPMEKFSLSLQEQADLLKANDLKTINYEASLKALNQQYNNDKNVGKYNTALKALKIDFLNQEFREGKFDLVEYHKKLDEINLGKFKDSTNELRIDIRALNEQYAAGKITLSQYASAMENANIDKFQRELKLGRKTVIEMNDAMINHKIGDFNRQAHEGTITMGDYRNSIRNLQLDKLNQQFAEGKITQQDYNKSLVETSNVLRPGSSLSVGLQNYISSAGTIAQNTANAVTQTFGHLEDSMTDFIKTGKFKFADFANAVIDDLNRIIVRSLIIRPLAEGILNAIPTGGGTAGTAGQTDLATGETKNMAAKGAAFDGMRSNFFAAGGVVNGRTNFQYGAGKKGIMGEAGPEAILPLTRTKGGDLGVVSAGSSNVIVNINNQTGGEVQQTESRGPNGERVLDILITQKVKEAFASGVMDKQMSQNYGLRRKGL